jgi:hypothetical protein
MRHNEVTIKLSGHLAKQALVVLMDVVVPLVAYYVLRAFGLDPVPALILAALPTTAFLVYRFIGRHKLDTLGIFILLLLTAGVVVSLWTGSPRFLLAKSGWVTAAIGIGFLCTLFLPRPLAFTLARTILDHGPTATVFNTGSWDDIWQRNPAFRGAWRICTGLWSAGLFGDAVVRVVVAYTLPVDVVPGLDASMWLITFVALQVVQQVYLTRSGVWRSVQQPGSADT